MLAAVPASRQCWKIDTQISRDETSSFQAWWMDQLGSTLKRRKPTRHGLPASRKPKTARSSYNISWEMRLTSTDKWQVESYLPNKSKKYWKQLKSSTVYEPPIYPFLSKSFYQYNYSMYREKWYKNVVYRIEASTSNTHDTKGNGTSWPKKYPRHWKNGIFGGRVRETTHLANVFVLCMQRKGFVLHLNPLRSLWSKLFAKNHVWWSMLSASFGKEHPVKGKFMAFRLFWLHPYLVSSLTRVLLQSRLQNGATSMVFCKCVYCN